MVRDFDMQRYGENGYQSIKKKVESRLDEMWKSIAKPDGY